MYNWLSQLCGEALVNFREPVTLYGKHVMEVAGNANNPTDTAARRSRDHRGERDFRRASGSRDFKQPVLPLSGVFDALVCSSQLLPSQAR